jgi:hypothetical protein
MTMVSLLPKYNFLRTPADVARFTGTSLDKLPPTLVRDITAAAKAGNYNTAIRLASNSAAQQPGHLQDLMMQAFPAMGMPDYTRSIWGSMSGAQLSDTIADTQRRFGTNMTPLDLGIMGYNGAGPKAQAYAASVESIYQGHFGFAATGAWNDKIGEAGYLKALAGMGIPKDIAQMIVADSKARGINPALAASVMLQEKAKMNPNAVHYDTPDKEGKPRFSLGLFQTENTNPYFNYAKTGKAGQVYAGVGYLADSLAKSGALGDKGYNIAPESALRGAAFAGQGNLNEAYMTSRVLEPAARGLAEAMSNVQRALSGFINALGSLQSTDISHPKPGQRIRTGRGFAPTVAP